MEGSEEKKRMIVWVVEDMYLGNAESWYRVRAFCTERICVEETLHVSDT